MDVLAVLAIGAVSLWAAADWVGEMDGRFWPVVGPLTLTDPTPYASPEYQHSWSGAAEKYRDCSPVRVEWFWGPRGGRRVQVQLSFSGPPQVWPTGLMEWDGVRISLPPAEVLRNSHSNAYHRCHPFWLTKSRFYDGQESAD